MRAIFVNYAHPEINHVSGTRLSSFAHALAKRGHQIVLLTSTLTNETPAKAPGAVSSEIASWSWERPYHLEGAPVESWALHAIRQASVPTLVRRTLTMTQMLVHGGVFNDWVEGARAYVRVLEEEFRPDFIWGTFGNTSNLVLAQLLAQRAGVPWFIDIKDNWRAFLPPSTRALMAWRFRDASAITANSYHHAKIFQQWSRKPMRVIYSGVPNSLVTPASILVNDARLFRINLVGSVYDTYQLDRFLHGVKSWYESLPSAKQSVVEFTYAGGAATVVEDAVRRCGLICKTRMLGYLPSPEFGDLCRAAAVNCYLWAPFTFHHKVIELLALGRPIICFPGEHEESVRLANECGGLLNRCQDYGALAAVLQRTLDTPGEIGGGGEMRLANVQHFTWDAIAGQLEAFFESALSRVTSAS